MIYVLTIGECSDFEVVAVYKGPPGADIAMIRKEWNRLYNEQGEHPWRLGSGWENVARQWLKEHPGFEELEWQEMWAGRDWG